MLHVLLLAFLLSNLLVAQQAVPVEMLPDSDSGSALCGSNHVTWANNRSFDVGTRGSATLEVGTAEGTSVLDLTQDLAPGEVLIPSWCGDLLRDGSQALAYEMFSGGAHCCFTATVVLLQPGARQLLNVDLGNGGLGQPLQLSPSGPAQLIAGSDVFAYFDNLSFAASPFMPLVFAYDGQEYFEATRLFPDYLRNQTSRAEVELSDAVAQTGQSQEPPQFAYQAQESIALRLYGLHVLIGDADAALPRIQAQLSPPAAQWLVDNAEGAAAAINAAYN